MDDIVADLGVSRKKLLERASPRWKFEDVFEKLESYAADREHPDKTFTVEAPVILRSSSKDLLNLR